MKRILLALLIVGLWQPEPALAQGVPNSAQAVSSCGTTPSPYTAGLNYPILQNTSGQTCTTGTSTVSGTVTANQGTPNAGTATNSWFVQGAGTAGTQSGGVVTIQGDPAATAIPTVPSPSSAATVGIVPIPSTAVESGHVFKASAGNLYSLSATAQTTTAGYVMVFNSATVPADGAVTPIICAPISGMPAMVNINYSAAPPGTFTTGISAAISSTGCATKTAIASGAWFTGSVK